MPPTSAARRVRDFIETGWAAALMIAVVAGINFWGNSALSDASREVNRFVGATRAALNVDMMHDAVRADVYVARYAEQTGDDAGVAGARADLGEHTTFMADQLRDAGDASLSTATREAYREAQREVPRYATAAAAAIDDPVAMAAFLDRFDLLEGKLGDFGESLESDASNQSSTDLWFVTPISLVALGVQLVACFRARAARRTRDRALAILAESSTDLDVAARDLSSGARDTAVESEVVAQASAETLHVAAGVSTAMNEFHASISEIAGSAHEALQTANDAIRTADAARETIEELATASQGISEVVDLISSIAESTSMLALNASIEAARAGESGRGFAVVAGEVKHLAAATARATEDIQHRVEGIQTSSASASAAVVEVVNVINAINSAQEAIAAAVEEQSATTDEVARNMEVVQVSAQQINDRVSSISGSATQSAQAAELTRTNAERLKGLAAEMQAAAGHPVTADLPEPVGAR